MSDHFRPIHDRVLIAIRRIMRAIDLRSKRLVTDHGITGPQLVVLTELGHREETSVGSLANDVNLSQATVTGVLDRLERKGFVLRQRSTADRRKVYVSLTSEGRSILERTPPVLQEKFVSRFSELEDWEQTLVLSSLQRIISMMEADEIEAGPMLTSDGMNAASPTGAGEDSSYMPDEGTIESAE